MRRVDVVDETTYVRVDHGRSGGLLQGASRSLERGGAPRPLGGLAVIREAELSMRGEQPIAPELTPVRGNGHGRSEHLPDPGTKLALLPGFVPRPPELVLIGAGGSGRETAEAVRAVNALHPTWDLIGFLDDDTDLHGSMLDGWPVLGPLTELKHMPQAQVVVCAGAHGDCRGRKRLVDQLDIDPERCATVIHPAAVLPEAVSVGRGSVVHAGVVATVSVRIGHHVAVLAGSVLSYDDRIDDFVMIGPGARLGGAVRVETGSYLGAGALVHEGRMIGAWSLVGMGAVVLADVPPSEVWAGVPARRLRAAPGDR